MDSFLITKVDSHGNRMFMSNHLCTGVPTRNKWWCPDVNLAIRFVSKTEAQQALVRLYEHGTGHGNRPGREARIVEYQPGHDIG